MKREKCLRLLPPLCLLLGLAGAELQKYLFAHYVADPVSGLLVPGTLPEILLWVLTAVVVVAAFLLTWGARLGEGERITTALSELFFSAGVLTLLAESLKGPAALVLIYKIVSVITALSLAASGTLRLLKKKPPFLLTVMPCVLCVLQMLEYYQTFSEVPQLMNYFFGLGAVLCLTMSAYQRMARAAGMPGKSWHYAVEVLAVYFCGAAIAQGVYVSFFCAAGVWMLMETTRLSLAEG